MLDHLATLERKTKQFLFLLGVLALLLLPANAFAADLTLTPSVGQFEVGQSFTVDVYVTNNTQAINAVSGTLTFPTDTLTVRSISKDGTIIKLWAEEPTFSNANGSVRFEGVILNPGFSGSRGKVVSLSFSAKKAGNANVIFSNGQVLANDGQATNVVGSLGNGSYSVSVATEEEPTTTSTPVVVTSSKPELTSPTHPDQNAWYASRDVTFEWQLPRGVTAVRTLYDTSASSRPTKVYDPAIKERSFTADGDDVYYMHVQFKDEQGWGDIAHYRFQIDTKAPSSLKATFPDGAVTSHPKPSVSIIATDALSGIEAYDMVVDDTATTTYKPQENNLYALPEQPAGKHTVTIYARDKAGNTTKLALDYTIIAITVPTITDYTKHAELGDVVKVTGTTYPQSVVEVIYFNTKSEELYKDTTTSDVDGNFSLLWAKKLPLGVYEMKVRVMDSKGASSAYSVPHVVTVERQSYVQIGMFVMNWLSLILILVIATTCVLATLWYSFIQFNRFRRKVHRTIQETENTLKANVAALRRDTEEFHTLLVKAEKKRELTKEEQAILKKFKKRLEITEKEIEKKLEQIG